MRENPFTGMRENQFTGTCRECGKSVHPRDGRVLKIQSVWHVYCAVCFDHYEAGLLPVPTIEPAPEPPSPPEPPPATKSGLKTAAERIAEALAAIEPALNEERVIELIRTHAPVPETITHERIVVVRQAERVELADKPRHAVFPDVLAAIGCGLNVYLVGPAGCGKTELASQVAEALGLRFGHTGAVGTRYDLSGYNDAQGNYCANTEFPEFYERGGLFLFDEIDGSIPNAVLFANTALANGHCAFPHRTIAKHADFRCIAAANTYGNGADLQYVGRNPLDAASKDRFVVIPMDYDEKLECALYGDTDWLARVHTVRQAVAQLRLRHVISMRAIAQGTALLSAGLSQESVEQYTLWRGLEADQVAKIEHSINKGA